MTLHPAAYAITSGPDFKQVIAHEFGHCFQNATFPEQQARATSVRSGGARRDSRSTCGPSRTRRTTWRLRARERRFEITSRDPRLSPSSTARTRTSSGSSTSDRSSERDEADPRDSSATVRLPGAIDEQQEPGAAAAPECRVSSTTNSCSATSDGDRERSSAARWHARWRASNALSASNRHDRARSLGETVSSPSASAEHRSSIGPREWLRTSQVDVEATGSTCRRGDPDEVRDWFTAGRSRTSGRRATRRLNRSIRLRRVSTSRTTDDRISSTSPTSTRSTARRAARRPRVDSATAWSANGSSCSAPRS